MNTVRLSAVFLLLMLSHVTFAFASHVISAVL